jgi:hypothetical protein
MHRKCSTKGDKTGAYLEDRGEKVLRERVLETSALGLAYRGPVGAAGNMAKKAIITSISYIDGHIHTVISIARCTRKAAQSFAFPGF